MPTERSDAELAKDLESLSLQFVERMAEAIAALGDDPVAADGLFRRAGEVEATLAAAAARLRFLRDSLDRAARDEGV
jgi:hypothetical protein